LLENLLLASFENTGAITAIDSGSAGLRADFMLRTEIRHFEAVYNGGSGAPYVWVEMIARLVAMPQRTIVAQARFQRSLPAAANSVPAVVAAFNAATKATLRDIVLWTLNNPALLHARR
jgi:cholesterol transport system auxiliary component